VFYYLFPGTRNVCKCGDEIESIGSCWCFKDAPNYNDTDRVKYFNNWRRLKGGYGGGGGYSGGGYHGGRYYGQGGGGMPECGTIDTENDCKNIEALEPMVAANLVS